MKVTVHYKGKGKVDGSHKLWVWLFDTPNIGPGAMPLDQVALDKNDIEAAQAAGMRVVALTTSFQAAHFDQLAAPPTLVCCDFDEFLGLPPG